MANAVEKSESTSTMPTFGLPWPDLNYGLSYCDVVSPSDSGLKVVEFYSSKYKNSAPLQGESSEGKKKKIFCRTEPNTIVRLCEGCGCWLFNSWLQRIQNGQIRIDGGVVTDPNTILRAGSELVYHRLPWREPDAPYLLEILFEDDDMIVINKPSGLQVLPGGLFQQRTVLTQLQWRPSRQSSMVACQQPHPVPVHRLGRGTSGILLCAKTKLAKTQLASYFADGTSIIGCNRSSSVKLNKMRKVSKIYRALVDGILTEDEVVIKQPIGMVQYPGVAKGLYVASPSGKPALTKVDVLERDAQKNHTLVQVEIQSGRPHQIRIHLSFIGHPLLGDPLYVPGGHPKAFDSEFIDESFAQDGGYHRPTKPVPGDCGYYLHAHQLILSHPTTNKVIKVIAPLPSVLQTQHEGKEVTN